MKRIAWMLERAGWRAPVLAALLLLAASASLHLWVLPPLNDRLDRLTEMAANETREPVRPPNVEADYQLRQFYRHFAATDALPGHLARLHDLARAHGLALRQGEYRLVQDRDAKLRRYQVIFPVQGSYPAVRRFVGAVLDTIPVAALDQVSFERKRIDDNQVDAQVRLTLFLAEP
jgi:hypothetical protein